MLDVWDLLDYELKVAKYSSVVVVVGGGGVSVSCRSWQLLRDYAIWRLDLQRMSNQMRKGWLFYMHASQARNPWQ